MKIKKISDLVCRVGKDVLFLFVALQVTSHAMASEDPQLEALRNAVSASHGESPAPVTKPKPKTRAIVFDDEPATTMQATVGTPEKEVSMPKAAPVPAVAEVAPKTSDKTKAEDIARQLSNVSGQSCPQDLLNSGRGIPVPISIEFDFGKSSIQSYSMEKLVKIAGILSANSSNCVLVEGHTDSVGSPVGNLKLSRERAEAVVSYLVNNHVDRGRLLAVGKGSKEPMDGRPPSDPSQRRVVFRVFN